jgi:hypothetical protein
LRGTANGGEVLLSSAAADLVVDCLPDGAALVDLGYRELRDLSRGEQVFALTHPDLEARLDRMADAATAAPERNVEPRPEIAGPEEHVPEAMTRGRAPRSSFPKALEIARAGATEATVEAFADESATISRALARARAGVRGIVVVRGGSETATAVVARAATEAYDAGAIALHGVCRGDGAPFEPFASALTAQLTEARDVAESAGTPSLGPLAGELTRLVPEVAVMAGVSTPLRADPETERYRLFDAVSGWIHELAKQAPVVFVLEHLEWVTADTVQLLGHLFRSTALLPVAWVLTIGDDPEASPVLTRFLAELDRTRGVEAVQLATPA